MAALCYLGAAALGRPWVAWAGIVGGSLVVLAGELVVLVWWAGIAALALVVASLAPRLGLVLAGVVLASHAGWDAVHYRRDRVVPGRWRSSCILLDVPLGVGFVVLAVLG